MGEVSEDGGPETQQEGLLEKSPSTQTKLLPPDNSIWAMALDYLVVSKYSPGSCLFM